MNKNSYIVTYYSKENTRTKTKEENEEMTQKGIDI